MNFKKVLFLSLAFVAMTQITACVPAVMVANIAAGGALSKGKAEREADRCYEIEIKADKQKVSGAEKRRRMTKAGCKF